MEGLKTIKKARVIAEKFIEFVNKAVSPYHVVGTISYLYPATDHL